jgi:hypothetical protein
VDSTAGSRRPAHRLGEGEERERLVVEHDAVVEYGAVGGDQRPEQAVGAPVAREEEVQALSNDCPGIALPPERRRARKAVHLARLDAGTPRLLARRAIGIQALVETAERRIHAACGPKRIRLGNEPMRERSLRLACLYACLFERSRHRELCLMSVRSQWAISGEPPLATTRAFEAAIAKKLMQA